MIMKNILGRGIVRSLASAAAVFAFVPGAGAAGSLGYVVSKIQIYFQKDSSGAIPSPSGYPYEFSAMAENSATLALPDGAIETLATEGGTEFEFNQAFVTLGGLDTAYPAGAYSLSGAAFPTATFNVGSQALYPSSIPRVTGGTWTDNVLAVDPTQAVTLNFSNFAGYGTLGAAGYMRVAISSLTSADSVSLVQSYSTEPIGNATVSATPFTSYVIPANTLMPGLTYLVDLTFDTITSVDSATIPGAVATATFTNRLDIFIGANSAPAIPAPTVGTQPTDQTAAAGGSATFSTTFGFGGASQPANVAFIWHFNGVSVYMDGARHVLGAGGSLTLNNLVPSDAGTYYATAITATGAISTHMVTLTVTGGNPVFSVQPTPVTVAAGGTAVFNASASGAPSYQWYLNGSPLAGATSSTLVIHDATAANAGSYSCRAANPAGSMTSAAAALGVVSTSNPGRLVNISCRASVGTGGNILIAGFVVGGEGTSGSQSLLIRGSGPALKVFNVSGTLADPQLQLFNSGGTVLETNDGWAGNAQIVSTAAAVGGFRWTDTSSHDAALLETLPTGAYTAQIAGESGDTGIALAEVYDATPAGSYTLASPRIVNISARVKVGTGGNILIAGFAIGGSTSKTVLIRASGPALATFNVPGLLPDPQLQLFNSAGTVIQSDNGWGGNAQVASAAASVGAFLWSLPTSKDSALLVTLPPGAYTAQVAGASGDTGVALVEIYEVP
jgi:hypothetical protein